MKKYILTILFLVLLSNNLQDKNVDQTLIPVYESTILIKIAPGVISEEELTRARLFYKSV